MTTEDVKRQYASEPWGKFLLSIGYEPYDTESAARDVARHAVDRIIALETALRPFIDGFDNHPGISDLYNEQPITISITLGEWRVARSESVRNRYDDT